MSVVTSGSQFSETMMAAVVCGTKRLQSPLFTPDSATAPFTFSVTSTSVMRESV